MGLIDINLDETPDRILPVAAGIRSLLIRDVNEETNAEDQVIHVVELEVNEPDAEDHERRTWDRFNFIYQPARVKFKQLCRAAGFSGSETGGVDTSDLIGQTVRAVVKPRTYQDKNTGETVETTQVSKYLFGPDEE